MNQGESVLKKEAGRGRLNCLPKSISPVAFFPPDSYLQGFEMFVEALKILWSPVFPPLRVPNGKSCQSPPQDSFLFDSRVREQAIVEYDPTLFVATQRIGLTE